MTAVATTEDHARRWAERARLDLEAAADRGESGLSKIRTAITERHDEVLGYRSLGDYLRTEYADALGNVCRVFGVEFRRQVVAELTEAGLSTRAIAPVVGTSSATVKRDVIAGGSHEPPAVDAETGEVSDDYLPDDTTGEEVTSDAPLPQASEARPRGERGPSHESANGSDVDDAGTTELAPPPAPRPSVVGLDGALQENLQQIIGLTKQNDAPPSVAAAAALGFMQIDAADTVEFFTLLARGAGTQGHPIVTLDKRLQRQRREGLKMPHRDYLALFILAWNAWRDGKQMSKFQRPRGGRWSEDNFPEPH